MSNSLWNFSSSVDVQKTPVQIIREQALLFNDFWKSGNIYAEVVQGGPVDSKLSYNMRVVAPLLNNYVLIVVDIRYHITGYPVRVSSEYGLDWDTTAENEVEYIGLLSKVLSSARLQQAVNSLVAHSGQES